MNVLITGASRGIGNAIASHFAAEGANLLLVARNMDKASAWQQALMQQYGISISAFNADLANAEGVSVVVEQILQATDQIDILVNNTGAYEPGAVWNEAEGQMERMLEVNFLSAYRLTRALLPSMMNRKAGHIFNIASIASLQAYEGGGSYSVSKFALDGFSKNLRQEMKAYGIKVTSVYPGATMTSSWEGSGVSSERIMEAADVAKMIVAASKLSPQACVEEILMRPLLGDL